MIIATPLTSLDGTLTKYGFGSLWLTAANTYNGSTRSVGGTIDVRHALALQNSTLDLNANDFGALWFVQSSTLGGLTGSRNMSMNGWTVSIGNNNADTTYSGVLSNGAIAKVGTGSLTLTGANTYSGGTTISAGRLIGTTTSLQGAITNNAAVTFNQATSGTYAEVMSGVGSLTKSGAGSLTLSGTSTYSGATTIAAGTLSVVGKLGATTVSVASGATLGGTGQIAGDILADGLLAPGVNGIGLLDVGSLTLNAGSTTALEIAGQGTGAGVAGTGYDSVLSHNGLTYGGGLALGFLSNPLFDNGTVFSLFQAAGTPGGTFTSVATAAGSSRYSGMSFQHHPNGNWYTADTAGGQYLVFSPATGMLSIVPEPSTYAMLLTGLAAGGWKMVRRRRQR